MPFTLDSRGSLVANALVRACPMAIVRADAEHRIVFVNPAFERLFGFSSVEALGHTVEDLIHYSPERATTKHGVEIALETTVVAVMAEQGINGTFYVLHDATADQRKERLRIARELHDDISQRLALLQISIDRLRVRPSQPADDVQGQLTEFSREIEEISTAMRAFVHDLHSRGSDERLDAALRKQCRALGERFALSINFRPQTVPDNVPNDVVQCVSRVLQEAVTNVVKHSGSSRMEVTLWGTAEQINFTMRDYGRGVTQQSGSGIGLSTMVERVEGVGGRLWVKSTPQLAGAGTEIAVQIPLPKRHAGAAKPDDACRAVTRAIRRANARSPADSARNST